MRTWRLVLVLVGGAVLVVAGVLMAYLITIARGMPHGTADQDGAADAVLVLGPLLGGLGLLGWGIRAAGRRRRDAAEDAAEDGQEAGD